MPAGVLQAAGGQCVQCRCSAAPQPGCPGAASTEGLAALCLPTALQGGVQGRVRSWAALEDDLLLFTMRDNRFCGNVGRWGRVLRASMMLFRRRRAVCVCGGRGH